MRGVMVEVSEQLLAERRRTGVDRFDEMWEGVLHMAPAPSTEHQRVVTGLIAWLALQLRDTDRGTILVQVNVFDEVSVEENYRIPDLTFVKSEQLIAADGIRGGGPDAVIEVRSPGDESYDKLPFYARIGTGEVIVIHRDTKGVEVFRPAGDGFAVVDADADGWVLSQEMGVAFRTEAGSLNLQDRHGSGGSLTI